MPLSEYRDFWSFQSIRNEDWSHNMAVYRPNELLTEIIIKALGGE